MSVRIFSTTGITGVKSSKFWDQVTRVYPQAFESIETYTVGSTSVANVDFTSIPNTYTHLQLRFIAKLGSNTGDINIRVGNGSVDTGTNYTYHLTYGSGTSTFSGNEPTTNRGYLGYYLNAADKFAAGIVDILDYKSTNKFKTIRCLEGSDTGTSGIMMLNSSVWRNSSSPISTIRIYSKDNHSFSQYSHFALYGLRS